jgi:prepilin-type N-terminal cleavage/methylation domain-containing protein
MRKDKRNVDYVTRLQYVTRKGYQHMLKRPGWNSYQRYYKLCCKLDQAESMLLSRTIAESEKGFTLLEVLIAIVLMSIVGWGFSSMMVGAARQRALLEKTLTKPMPVVAGTLIHVNGNEAHSGGLVLACLGANEDDEGQDEDFSLCSKNLPCTFNGKVWVQGDASKKKCKHSEQRTCTMGVLIKQ